MDGRSKTLRGASGVGPDVSLLPPDKLPPSCKSLMDLVVGAGGRAEKQQDRQSFGSGGPFTESSGSFVEEPLGTSDAMAWAWGSGKYGRLGLGSTVDVSVPAPVTALAGRIVSRVAAGAFVTAFLCDHGKLYMCGKDTNDLFAGAVHPSERLHDDYLSPVAISFFDKVSLVEIAVGETLCAAVGEYGDLFWWGKGFGSGKVERLLASSPSNSAGRAPGRFVRVVCGASHALGLMSDGRLFAWGDNTSRQIGAASLGEFVAAPVEVRLPTALGSIVDAACGYSSTAVLGSDGSVFAAGTVVGQQELRLLPAFGAAAVVGRFRNGGGLRRVYCHDAYVCSVSHLGEAFLFHSVPLPFAPDVPSDGSVRPIFADLSVRDLVCGPDFVSALTDAGCIYSWGRCSLQLGVGEAAGKKSVVGPRLVSSCSARFVRSASFGSAHVAAILAPSGSQRELLGWELLETERIHYRSLVLLLEGFRGVSKPRSTLGKLFAEVESMLQPHAELLAQLGDRMEMWSDATVLGPLLQRIAKRANIECYTRFHRLLSEWSKQASKYLPGGKRFAEANALPAAVATLRKGDSAGERKKPLHMVGLLGEPFERMRQYFWLCTRLVAATPNWHADARELAAASEAFQRELAGYYSEHEMQRMTIARLEGDKEELLKRLVVLSTTNDSLFLSRNNHAMHQRQLGDVLEQHEHKMRTMTREMETLRERLLQTFLERRCDSIRRRRAEALAERAAEEAVVLRAEARRLEAELTIARSTKLFRDVLDLRTAVAARDREVARLREELAKTVEASVVQTYTEQHVRAVEAENARLTRHLESVRGELVEAVRRKHAPIVEAFEPGAAAAAPEDAALLNSDGTVRGSSVAGLVRLLVLFEAPSRDVYDAYLRAFFLTYRVFITPVELQYALQELYCLVTPDVDPPVLWSRVLGVLRHWITEHLDDFTAEPAMRALLWTFLDETVRVTLSPATADAIAQDFHRQTLGNERALADHAATRAALAAAPPPSSASDAAAAEVRVDERVVVAASAAQLAEQLALIESELMAGIEAKELLGCQWLKPNKEVRAPAVVAVTRRFNRVCSWAVTEVLSRPDPKDRRDVVCALILAAAKARAMGALNTTMELVAALNNGAVQRLKRTWELVPRRERAQFEELEEFVSSKGSYKQMREAIRERREKQLPVLPYIGVYLTDLIYTDEGSLAELSPGVVNFGRLMAISGIIREVLDFKKTPFAGVTVVPKLRAYLIGCSILSEDETWAKSTELEPRVQSTAE